MVNNRKNIGAWDGEQPPPTGANRRIEGGPLYPLDQIEPLLEKGALFFWTQKCVEHAADLQLEPKDAAALVLEAVKNGRYHCSEWCEQKPGGPVAACDAYVLIRKEWNKYAYKELPCEYFFKFAVTKTGQAILLVSCHPSRDKSL